MNFELNKINQLEILTGFCVMDEQGCCPSCKSKVYSSIYMEKNSSKNPQAYTITVDSEGPHLQGSLCNLFGDAMGEQYLKEKPPLPKKRLYACIEAEQTAKECLKQIWN